MSKYKVGDVVFADVSYFDTKSGYYKAQTRRFVVINVNDVDDEVINVTVSLTGEIHQANRHRGIIVKANSKEGIAMACTKDTFIYCDFTTEFKEDEILRRFAICPIIDDILKKIKES